MEDVQNYSDYRGIPINRVGLSGLRLPIVISDKKCEQKTVARLTMHASLSHQLKGTHLSRFIEVVQAHCNQINRQSLSAMLGKLRERLGAESAYIELSFPFFLERVAPVTKAISLVDYECSLTGKVSGEQVLFTLGVRVPVTSVCPCSKAISDRGAHNQRSYITIQIRENDKQGGEAGTLGFEDLIEIAELSASAPVFTLLKRPDERHVTMQAFDNPMFVEDMVRNVATRLQSDIHILWFRVHAVSQESIHNHDVFAEVEWSR